MSGNILETPWKNGVWISDLNSATIFKVNGQDVERYVHNIIKGRSQTMLANFFDDY